MKVQITFLNRIERTSAKSGKPYTSLSIKTNQYGDKYLSGFGNDENASWKVGDEVEIDVATKTTDKGEFLNFTVPKIIQRSSDTSKIEVAMGFLHQDIKVMREQMNRVMKKLDIQNTAEKNEAMRNAEPKDINWEPNDAVPEITTEDVPF